VALDYINLQAAQWVGFIVHLAVRGLLASASLVELAPWVARRVPPPSLLLICAYYASLIAALIWRQRPRLSLLCASATGVCGWLMVSTLALPHPRSTQSSLRVTFLDVGQGDAAIVQFPNGRTLSIDAGGIAGTSFDIGGRVVSPTFWALGIRRLDYMSISHSDPDHIGGAASVFRDFSPFEVWEGVPVPRNTPTNELRAIATSARAKWRNLTVDDRFTFGDVDLVVRHPPQPDWERQKVRNDDSEVLELRYRDVSFVFTGDIGREVERDIARAFEPAAIRILKVPHHGSGTSSSMEFLRALRPDIAVVSAGRGNPFGHPVATVLARYAAVGTTVFRTDQDGAVMVDTDGVTVHVESFTKRSLTLRSHQRATDR
jgi:competence protein ComEC